MSSATVTPESAELTKWEAERKLHGPVNTAQQIGHAVRSAEFVAGEDGKRDSVWFTIAISRGEDYEDSFYRVNIYGVTKGQDGDESTRPSSEDMQNLAEQITVGQRLKLQGMIDAVPFRASQKFADLAALLDVDPEDQDAVKAVPALNAAYWSANPQIVLFVNTDDLPVPHNKEGRRPITLLPKVGEDSRDSKLPY